MGQREAPAPSINPPASLIGLCLDIWSIFLEALYPKQTNMFALKLHIPWCDVFRGFSTRNELLITVEAVREAA